jgi:hypothetical protein
MTPTGLRGLNARKRMTVLSALVVAATAFSAAAAFACTNLATLNLSSGTGKPGDTITVTGSSFRMPREAPTGVQIRWNGVDGPVLAETRPDRVGNISATFTVPEAPPDNYVIVAVLRDARGADTSGTPARAQFQILGPGNRTVAAPLTEPAPPVAAGESSSTGLIALTVALGVGGLALFAAGFVAFARQARVRRVPTASPVRND